MTINGGTAQLCASVCARRTRTFGHRHGHKVQIVIVDINQIMMWC